MYQCNLQKERYTCSLSPTALATTFFLPLVWHLTAYLHYQSLLIKVFKAMKSLGLYLELFQILNQASLA